jgi:hypothetical protein
MLKFLLEVLSELYWGSGSFHRVPSKAHKEMVVGLLKFDYLRIDLKPSKAAFIKSNCGERL